MSVSFSIESFDEGKRVDLFVSEKLNISRAKAQELIEKGYVKINNSAKPKSYKLKPGDFIEIYEDKLKLNEENQELIPQNIPIELIYRDDYLVVLSKPAGMVVYPCAGHKEGTLLNALAYHFKKLANIGAPLRPGVVHRLDKDTSGVIVIALDDRAYYGLVEMFKKRQVKKEYLAIVYGELKEGGTITLPIGRAENDRKKMSTKAKRAKEAITEWQVLENFKNYTLVKVKIITGRTHQIRVHFSAIGHPLLGDRTYGRKTYIEKGNKKIPVLRQMLHAWRIEFKHPVTGENLKFESPLPEDMKKVVELLYD
ncbi:MAG: RluA family pseudouridine synthase [Thermodesulfovibrio sp.]|uniref:RluA family pseudouridine synthase n=1 Tax=unclassified Thermodesulfovibrio TaxID=2645936 RepID=UPI00083B33DD|nr:MULTISPECIES: RluA family pseudouridine synthase [unclassified Thermodesulfovibrio]MDI1472883.1 RluA family pseudouridine synthase [Thermodesulfovibrio sp. 1176]MDI6714876.1 RluA family pseudouridine synthase [Thermodesulfovibrio sp.]ODA44738.1 Ribosomal large subunit pseudouridine synthase D [Thermodesulfovibrio sp. N1]